MKRESGKENIVSLRALDKVSAGPFVYSSIIEPDST
jgi:hypothetical protein